MLNKLAMQRSITVLFFVLINLICFNVFAQHDEVTYEPIEISEIPDYNRETRLEILKIQEQLEDSIILADFTMEFDTINKQFKELAELFGQANISGQSLDNLDRWNNKWEDVLEKLTLAYSPIESGEEEFLELYNSLNTNYQVILETILATKNSNLPNDVKENLNATKVEVRKMRTRVKEKHSVYLTYKTNCNELANQIYLLQNEIKQAKEDIMKNLLVAEQPVLWKAFSLSKNDTVNVIVHAKPIEELKTTVNEYLKQSKSSAYVILIVLGFFLALFFYIRHVTQTTADLNIPENDKAVKLLLFRPILASFVFTWMLVVLALDLPKELNSIFNLLMIPIIYYLLIELFGKQSLQGLLIFGFFYIFRNVEFLFDSSIPHNRIIFLFINLITLFIIVRALRRGFLSKIVSKWRILVRMVFNLLIILLSAAFIFNFAGNVILSNIILVGSVEVVLSGILLLAAFAIFEALINLILILPALNHSNIIRNHSTDIKKILRNILVFVMVITWLNFGLIFYGVHTEVIEWLKEFIQENYKVGTVSFSLSNVFAFIITIYLTVQISKGIRLFLNEEIFERSQTPKGASGTIILLVRFSITTLGFLMALAVAGIGLENITIVIGALGVGIGFGLQNIFNNLISGLILAFERPIKIDDIIQVGELSGVVKEIGFRSSTISTFDGSDVIVPNGDILSNQMINWTLSNRKKRLRLEILLGLEAKPEEVISLLKQVASESSDIVKYPNALPLFLGYKEGMQHYQFLFWIANLDNALGASTAVMLGIHNKLIEAGIKIPYPQKHIRIVDEGDKTRNEEIG